MEFGEFLKAPIGPILVDNFVEARLHTDTTTNHRDRILELQELLAGDQGLPTYVVVDSATGDDTSIYRGITIDEEEVQDFVLFLEEGLQKAQSRPASIPAK